MKNLSKLLLVLTASSVLSLTAFAQGRGPGGSGGPAAKPCGAASTGGPGGRRSRHSPLGGGRRRRLLRDPRRARDDGRDARPTVHAVTPTGVACVTFAR
jgi:hypothetical protein